MIGCEVGNSMTCADRMQGELALLDFRGTNLTSSTSSPDIHITVEERTHHQAEQYGMNVSHEVAMHVVEVMCVLVSGSLPSGEHVTEHA